MQHYLRYLFPCLLGLFCGGSSLAQVSFGLKAATGLNIINDRVESTTSISPYLTIGLGGFASFPLSEAMGIQTEINYLTQPGAPFQFNAFSVPLLLTYKWNSGIELEAGPSLQRDFSSHNYYTSNFRPYLNLGTNAGVSYWFSEKLSVSMRYTLEVFRTKYDLKFLSDTEDPFHHNMETSYRDSYLTASLRYRLNN